MFEILFGDNPPRDGSRVPLKVLYYDVSYDVQLCAITLQAGIPWCSACLIKFLVNLVVARKSYLM